MLFETMRPVLASTWMTMMSGEVSLLRSMFDNCLLGRAQPGLLNGSCRRRRQRGLASVGFADFRLRLRLAFILRGICVGGSTSAPVQNCPPPLPLHGARVAAMWRASMGLSEVRVGPSTPRAEAYPDSLMWVLSGEPSRRGWGHERAAFARHLRGTRPIR